MRDTILDMQQEYNRLTDEQITNLKRQPSNLNYSSGGNLPSDMPTVKEQELTMENKFLKQRIAIQQKKIASADFALLSNQNKLLKTKVEELETLVEELSIENTNQLFNLSSQSPQLLKSQQRQEALT